MKYVTRSPRETAELGERLGLTLNGSEVIALSGDMGSGKTAFTKGIAKGLGIAETVTSPTFAVMNLYRGRLKLCHYDAYRLLSAAEAAESGLDEYFGRPDCVCVIEWADRLQSLIPDKTIWVQLKYLSEKTREILWDDKRTNKALQEKDDERQHVLNKRQQMEDNTNGRANDKQTEGKTTGAGGRR